jgi:UDP-GlcNAc:undecaprenyl-phosphate/decaprenyl-phosphate GlcNAc-1-phosphate transferase
MNLLILGSVFIALGIVSALFNYLLLRWTRTLGRKNEVNEGEIRWSDSYKPALGGISFFLVFLLALLAYFFQHDVKGNWVNEGESIGLILVVSVGFFAGLIDDAYNTVPWFKFLAQFSCGVLLVTFGLQINFFGYFWADAALTILWTISVMNSINMLDNMDGITTITSISILTCAGICALPLSNDTFFYTLVCGGLVSGLFGFLIFNWNPSKIFMGDTGSQLLGALLAGVGIVFFWNNENIIESHGWFSKLAIVLCAFVVPIGDSITVTINRLKRGQSPFVGGRDHTTHHLSYAGLTDRQVAYVMGSLLLISVLLIGGLHLVDDEFLTIYIVVIFIYAISAIAFLYSTTIWEKPRAVFKARQAAKK